MKDRSSYFEIWDDMQIKGRWHLRGPLDRAGDPVEPWQFKEGRHLEIEQVFFSVDPRGDELEFTLASFSIPVVHSRVVELLIRLGLQEEIQLIPARVGGHPDHYFALNVLKVVRCIDDARCEEVRLWTEEDGQPDRVGEYRVVSGLKIDATKTNNASIFRPWGWQVALIVSERVKLAMEDEDVIGPTFTEV